MGYYSSIEFKINSTKVDLDKIKEIEKYFDNSENEHVYGFYGVRFDVDKENFLKDIELNEYYAEFYDDKFFAQKLSEAVTDGNVKLFFTGEDGIKWAYKITPNKIEELNLVYLTNDEYAAFNKFKPYLKVLYELNKKADDEILVKTINGSGACDLKLKKGTTAGQVKNMLKFLFNDLAHDLGIHENFSDYDSIFVA